MTIRGMIYTVLDALLLIAALGTGIREIYLAALCLGVCWVYGLVSLLIAAASLRVSGHLDENRVTRGDTVLYRVELQGTVVLPLAGRLSILPPGVDRRFDGNRHRHAFALMCGSRTRELNFDLPCPHRGCWQVGLEHLRLQDLFGLFALMPFCARGQDSILLSLEVVPRAYPLEAVQKTLPASNGYAMAQIRSASSGDSLGDTRPYQMGDPVKRIHWKQTARMGEIYVRQYEEQENPQILLLMDGVFRSSYVETATDLSCEILLSVARHYLTRGKSIRVLLLRPQGETARRRDINLRVQNEDDYLLLERMLTEISLERGEQPLPLWKPEDEGFGQTSTLHIITDNPSEELLDELSVQADRGMRVSCLIPKTMKTASPVVEQALDGAGLHPVEITAAAEISRKVGVCL